MLFGRGLSLNFDTTGHHFCFNITNKSRGFLFLCHKLQPNYTNSWPSQSYLRLYLATWFLRMLRFILISGYPFRQRGSGGCLAKMTTSFDSLSNIELSERPLIETYINLYWVFCRIWNIIALQLTRLLKQMTIHIETYILLATWLTLGKSIIVFSIKEELGSVTWNSP